MLNKLLKSLPKEYHKCIREFESDTDLIDDCKYMLYLDERYTDETSIPCRTIKEAVQFTKDFCNLSVDN